MQQLIIELQNLRKKLNDNLKEIERKGYEKAKTEYNYKIALSKEMRIERENKMPVTIINEVVKGKKEIAQLRFYRDNAASSYDVAYEKQRAIKLEIGIVEGQINATRKGE